MHGSEGGRPALWRAHTFCTAALPATGRGRLLPSTASSVAGTGPPAQWTVSMILAIWSPGTAAHCGSRCSASSVLLRALCPSDDCPQSTFLLCFLGGLVLLRALRLPVRRPTPRGLHDVRHVVVSKRLCGRVQGGLLFLLQKQKRKTPGNRAAWLPLNLVNLPLPGKRKNGQSDVTSVLMHAFRHASQKPD